MPGWWHTLDSTGSETPVFRALLHLALCVSSSGCSFVFLFSRSVVSNSFVTPRTVAHQLPKFMKFPRQEYWSELSFPSLGDLSKHGIEPTSSALQADSKESLGHRGSPATYVATILTPWTISTISSLGLKNYFPNCCPFMGPSFRIYSPHTVRTIHVK